MKQQILNWILKKLKGGNLKMEEKIEIEDPEKHICETFPVEYCPGCKTFVFKKNDMFEEIILEKGIEE